MIVHPRGPTLALAAALLAGCGGEVTEAPDPPSIDALIERFEPENIDGRLTAESAEDLFTGLVADVAVIIAAGALVTTVSVASDNLDAATAENSNALTAAPEGAAGPDAPTAERSPAVGTDRHAISASAGAWARLTHICPGLDGSVDRANGALQLQTLLEDLANLVIWGDALDCTVAGLDGEASTFAAELIISFETATSLILATMIGDMTVGGEPTSFSLEMSYIDSTVQLRRDVEGVGAFLVGIANLDAQSAVEVQVTDAFSTWTCGYEVEPSGVIGRCASAGGEVLTWP